MSHSSLKKPRSTNSNPGELFNWGDIPEWAFATVRSLLEALKVTDPQTYYHCLRVGEYSRLLAKSAGLSEYLQRVAQFSGMLHDIGKIGIDKNIVHKPGKLTDEEYEKMKHHPEMSEEIIRPLAKYDFFAAVLPGVRSHHERVDGKGYPDGLQGDEVPLIARIILIVDTLDAMGQTRAYRTGMSIDVIYKEIKRCMGTQFDLQLGKIFLESHPHWHKEQKDKENIIEIIRKVA